MGETKTYNSCPGALLILIHYLVTATLNAFTNVNLKDVK